MPDIERLEKTLRFLDGMYQQHEVSDDPEEAVAFSKLAVLEFCGWIEMTIDEIARSAVCITLPKLDDRKPLEQLIRNTSGFNYEKHVIPLLVTAIGSTRFSVIEKTLKDEAVLDQFKGILNSNDFTTMRNRAAHTFNDGTQRNYDAPSAVIGKLRQVAPLFERIKDLCKEVPQSDVSG